MKPHLIEKGMSLILQGLEVDLTDRNFIDTPDRYARFLIEMFGKKDIEYNSFTEKYSDFVLFKNHQMFSLCPHHMLPVEFKASMAYVPNGHVLGLSKLARVLDEANDGPILQEKFTERVVHLLVENCPGIKGAACLIDGQHSCTHIRGVKSTGRFVTYHLEGLFEHDQIMQDRFFKLVGG